MNEVLTVGELAAFLRTESTAVVALLESGELVGFRVSGEWRIPQDAVLRFLDTAIEKEQLRILERKLRDGKEWALQAVNDPEFAGTIEQTGYAPGTLGALIKEGIQALRAEAEGKVIDINAQRRK